MAKQLIYEQVAAILSRFPDYAEILRLGIEVEAERLKQGQKYGLTDPLTAWTRQDVQSPHHILDAMLNVGLLVSPHQSRTHTMYQVAQPEMVKEVLQRLTDEPGTEVALSDIPTVLDSMIVGHPDLKNLLTLILQSPSPVHLLMVGPPASAKSLVLAELLRLPNVQMVLGGAATRTGISEVLLASKPRFLLVDEIDKSQREDLGVLLRLMEHGELVINKHGLHIAEPLNTTVIAAANHIDRIPWELKSRFWIYEIAPYNPVEMKEIIVQVLVQRENKTRKFAELVAGRLASEITDVRDAIRVARLARNEKDVENLIRLLRRRNA